MSVLRPGLRSSFILLFTFSLSFAQTAGPSWSFQNVDDRTLVSSTANSQIAEQFAKVYAAGADGRIMYDRGGMAKAYLISDWMQLHPQWRLPTAKGTEDIAVHYYHTNKPVFNKIDREFKDVYFGIENASEVRLKTLLRSASINFRAGTSFTTTTYVLRKRPTRGESSATVILSAIGMCVRQNIVVSVQSPGKIFSSLPCPGGHTIWFSELDRISFSPLCGSQLCKTEGEVHGSVKSTYEGATLIAIPDGGPAPYITRNIRSQ